MRRLFAIGVLAILFAVAFAIHRRVADMREAFPAESDISYVPPAGQLRWMSLGYREALADLLWVRALVFTGEHIGKLDAAATYRYVDAITGLAPRFRRVYAWGGVTAIYGTAGTITRSEVDHAIAMYRAGLHEFPESHELLFSLGMLLTQQLRTTPGYTDAEIADAREEGIELIRRAAAFGADPLVRRYAATLVTEHATEQLAIQFLQSQLAQATDDAHRRLLRVKLAALTDATTVDAIERTREEFLSEHAAHAPYLPESLWAVIRPEPSPLTR